MKVSLNTLQYHSNVQLDSDKDRLVHKIGAQIGAVEEVVDWGQRYKGIVVVRVVACQNHPNADKLSVCLIDDGGVVQGVERQDGGLVEVVCGAPNVREAMLAAWIPPGAVVPATFDKDPFMIEARELRGVVSNGMLASASELGINDDHSGLLEISPSDIGDELAKPGTEFSRLYGLNDTLIEIENKMFTHRPDCFGILGIAREVAGVYLEAYQSPDWYKYEPTFSSVNKLELSVDNTLPELTPRFMAVAMDEVQIKPSPIWLQALLTRIGIKPINNIVDSTNYLAYLTGQPLHAYDYDKVAQKSSRGAELVVRYPEKGEQVDLLNRKQIIPRSEAIMIATDKELIGVVGVMGGTETEVDDQTTKIILECANFDMYSIRRTSMAHGLFTEAVTRFTKKQSPAQLPYVLAQAMQMAAELGGATQASAVIDNNAANYSSPVITTSAEFINSRLGTELSSQEIAKILSNVEFKVELGDQIEVTVPFWRTDIKVSEDLVEEVGRLHGYDKLPSVLPSRTLSPVGPSPMLEFKQNLRTTLSLMGANEVLTYSFVHGDLLAKVGQKPEMAFKLTNAISPELQYYRLSLTPSLLQLVHPNVKAGHNQFALFELGKAHQKGQSEKADEPLEQNKLALVVAAKSNKAAAYYQARTYLDAMVARIGVTLDYHKMTEQDTLQPSAAPYEPSRSALVCCSDNVIGVIGEFSMNVIQNLKLPSFCAGFEIDTEKLLAATKEKGQKYTPIPRYPSIAQDMCLEVGAEVAFSEVRSALVTALNKVTQVNELATQTLIDIFVDPNRPEVKRITFRLTFSSYERTLQESYVNELMDDVFSEISQQLNATRI